MLDHTFRGIYHMEGSALRALDFTNATILQCCISRSLSSYDFDELTRLVIAAHDERVRVTIGAASSRYIRLLFHNRTAGLYEGAQVWDRHPTMEQAIAIARGLDPRKGRE